MEGKVKMPTARAKGTVSFMSPITSQQVRTPRGKVPCGYAGLKALGGDGWATTENAPQVSRDPHQGEEGAQGILAATPARLGRCGPRAARG